MSPERIPSIIRLSAGLAMLLSAALGVCSGEPSPDPAGKASPVPGTSVAGQVRPSSASPQVLWARRLIEKACARANAGSPGEALTFLKEARFYLDPAIGTRASESLGAQQLEARCLEMQGRFDEAQGRLRAVHDVLRLRNGPSHPDTLAVKDALCRVLERGGKAVEAQALRVEGLAQPSSTPTPQPLPACLDPAFRLAGNAPIPWLQLLTYREGLILGLRLLMRLEVTPEASDDLRIPRDWKILPPTSGSAHAPAVSVAVTFVRTGSMAPIEVQVDTAARHEVLRRLPPAGEGTSAIAAGNLALEDLPRLAMLAGIPAQATPVTPSPGTHAAEKSAPWEPGGLVGLWHALRPLADPDSGSNRDALARGARALAWEALLDFRLAPTLSARRAAQALALAALASRDGAPTPPEARVAQWLAPAAANGDFWLLAGADPPAGWPELVPLHEAYRGVDDAMEKTSAAGLGQFIGGVERAAVLDRSRALADAGQAVHGKAWEDIAWAYLVQFDDFETLATAADAGVRCARSDLAALRGAGLEEPPRSSSGSSGASPVSTQVGDLGAGEDASRVLTDARNLYREMGRHVFWVDRLVLEDAAERMIHGLCGISDQMRQYGVPGELKRMGARYKAHVDWQHPEVQWQMTAPDLEALDRRQRERAERIVCACAGPIPNLVHLYRDYGLERRITGAAGEKPLVVGNALYQYWHDDPRAQASLVRSLVPYGLIGPAAAIAVRLAREQGLARAPFFGETWRGLGEMVRQRVWMQMPSQWRQYSPMVHHWSAYETAAGRVDIAQRMLTKAVADLPSDPLTAYALAEALVSRGDVARAKACVESCLSNHPEGLSGASLASRFSGVLFMLGHPEDSLEWAARAAASGAEWAILWHAEVCAVRGAFDDTQRDLEACKSRYGESVHQRRVRALVEVLKSKGTKGWEELMRMLGGDLKVFTAALLLGRAGVPWPSSPVGKELSMWYLLEQPTARAEYGPVDLAIIDEALARIAAATGPLKKVLSGALRTCAQTLLKWWLLDQVRGHPTTSPTPPAWVKRWIEVTGLADARGALRMGAIALAAGAALGDCERAMRQFATALPASESALLGDLLAIPDGARDLMALSIDLDDIVTIVQQWIQFLWLTGEDANAVRALAAILRHVRAGHRSVLELNGTLALLSGSLGTSRQWLQLNGATDANRLTLHQDYLLERELLQYFRPAVVHRSADLLDQGAGPRH